MRDLLYLHCVLLLASCATPGLHDAPSSASLVGTAFPEPSGKTHSKDAWWRSFGDPTLNEIIAKALEKNFEISAAVARIDQADASLRQAGGRLFPTLTADGSYARMWTTDRGDGKRDTSTNSRIGSLLDWELDVWGRLRAARNARADERNATVADWIAARLLLSASVAETYFEILEQKQQVRLLEEQVATNQTLLDLTELRFGQAQSSIVDVLQQREQLAGTRSRQPDVAARLKQLEYALDVLLGDTPGRGSSITDREFPSPSAIPKAGVPSDLLKNHPALVASAFRISAIDHDVAEAIADRLPRVSIGGSIAGIGTPGIDTVLANTIASITGPIIDAGIRQAEVDRRRAALKEALALYSHAYLAAVRDVETAVVLEQKQSDRVLRLVNQLAIAQQLLQESRHRYSQGLTDYLPVLTAVETEQNLQHELITSKRELLSFRIAIYRALGGPL